MMKLAKLRKLLELIRFSHTVFALPFALLAAVMAWTIPVPSGQATGIQDGTMSATFRWRELFGILLCMVLARSAAMAFNRLADRDVDRRNPRTAGRHLAVGSLSVRSVVVFSVVMSVGFIATTLLFLPNRWPIYLAVPVLLFLCAYSWTKRFTSLSHFWLGAALMLAPISAWIAIRGEFLMSYPADLWPPVVLGLAVLFWVAGFDIIYACQDAEFDQHAQLYSVPSRLGIAGALRVAALCHCGMIGVLVALPWLCPQAPLGWIYLAGITAVAILLLYEHWIVRPQDLAQVNIAFLHVNAVVSIGLFAVVTLDLLT